MQERMEYEILNRINIRQAFETDMPTIEGILRDTVQNPYGSGNVDEDEVQMELCRIKEAVNTNGEDRVVIALNGQKETLGFAFYGKPDLRLLNFTQSSAITTLELKLLYLNPKNRTLNIGSKLLNYVEQAAKSMDKSKIELTSGPRYISIGTGKFYIKKGYRQVGTINNYFENQYWARVFQKKLS